MFRRRKRFSLLARVPGSLELLSRRGGLPWGRPHGLGSVAHRVLRRALQDEREKPLDIVISTGPSLEPWNPDTLREQGIGGAETMAWELSRHLVRLGHRVRVFAHCLDLEGTFEGVEWLNYRQYRNLTCDVLLASRNPAAVDEKYEIAAKVRILWMHVVHVGDRLTPERDQAYDAYFCLSAWHAANFHAHYPFLSASKIIRVRNGIEPSEYRLRPGEQRDPLRAVFSSAPSRGLQIALDSWPAIVARVPGATLHIYYGFESWEQVAKIENDQPAFAVIAAMKQQIADTEGIVYHGKVNPQRLAAAFRVAGVWAYPDWTPETSCITAMQAQAAGHRIVSSAIGALPETVGARGTLLTENPRSAEYKEAFVEATVAALRAAQADDGLEALRDYAEQHFGLTGLAREFEARFRELILARAVEGLSLAPAKE